MIVQQLNVKLNPSKTCVWALVAYHSQFLCKNSQILTSIFPIVTELQANLQETKFFCLSTPLKTPSKLKFVNSQVSVLHNNNFIHPWLQINSQTSLKYLQGGG